ncbi:hypothetical protein KP509_05G076500 [Ceratopteris richardii]|uniref:Uncharacterized protein n=1 Tax=Ceratopteris richardii TaxID=49495 RepID=A0A8T2UZU0_CERRI|nr:hypothetical protein KP509_05G076500 [Ceratopteris richardii]KAH7437529.1 hypothetical protein KP509_05G076500 [Ceratopteris richardii]KAH7437530.1 hypothetical protein KP509_05G076500 [Ceratopteris richardii]KAH7437531.1 hypothetical protein KP509_05G076500 [Ceratopteris richardii]KAH7437532.1 hypothetical protein KP509_05G076500 [Ceratopteris richardii]
MKQASTGPYRKGHWSVEEDIRLMQFVRKYGEGRWSKLAKAAGLQRCGKSCRLRWVNYLRPDIKRGHISEEEERLIIHLHAHLGNRWSLIALHLPGRSDNEIKNYWRSHIKKKLNIEDFSTQEGRIVQVESFSSSEGSQNAEDCNTTLIEGSCYDVIGFGGCQNATESFKCFSIDSGRDYDCGERAYKSSADTFQYSLADGLVFPKYGHIMAPEYTSKSDLQDAQNTLQTDGHTNATFDTPYDQDPQGLHDFNTIDNYKQTKMEVPTNDQDLQILEASWDNPYIAEVNENSPLYHITNNQANAVVLHESEVLWDVESVQQIVDTSSSSHSMVDSMYGLDLWENEMFSSSDLKFASEQ